MTPATSSGSTRTSLQRSRSMTVDKQAPQWLTVDEGWGRRAIDFASLLEPAACREYVAMHHHLEVREGDRLLDIACGSGLAMELAAARGAVVTGIDASPRLIAIARDRVPDADVRVGDMAALPWDDDSFDVVTSFRGMWGTTREALAEASRVLRPSGRISVTSWGHLKVSPGAWALAPFVLAPEEKVDAQARMVSIGRPGVGEELLAEAGFVGVRRHAVPFAWEFPDPETYARMLASTGPAYEAIQAVGEEEFHRYCVELAIQRVREGLPLRAEIDCVGFTAQVPEATAELPLLGAPAATPGW
ncbi:class I SAM-dependent methyltransferase [Nocardioides eburneiflavus]|uniref:Class I SAM-dependent methyltransferase n=2 Tax=Nocardioides eburneiflavus TaxID=2518372 RepID=A0A4Z1CD61_9ACTN|nr:class I SAM-dependent methyltransferase [Nocardioides eburneiflavus]